MEAKISAGMKRERKMDFQERVRRRNEFDAGIAYGVKKFNLLTGRDKHAEYRKKNDNQWINLETGVIDDKFAECRNCPLCGANEFETLFVKCGFPHVKCNRCNLVYVNPILNQQEYEKLWQAEDSWESILESEPQIKMQTLEARYSLDIAELCINNKDDISICDVGCGPGRLLGEAKKRGYYAFGIEPNRRSHNSLREKGIDYLGDFFPLKEEIKKKFDCIFLLNALEHMRDPMQIVLEAKKLLRPSGIIYISVPCIDALVNRIMHEKAGVFGGHSHLQFFSIGTLSVFLEKAGFKVLEYETIITEIGVIKNYLSFKDPYFGDNVDLLDFLTPELIYKNHLARNLNMVGRLV
ncbi:MAG: class I SAM-dependent methyltransferase [Candidatus Omnitrophota bacterium]|nr:MAG: class I SAM-dependent methyltransferase [Candidatus Omnitrophota bacterium]